MNREVAEYLKDYLTPLWWADKVGGMVITARSGVKAFPVEFNANPQDCETQFHDYVPDESKKSIIYFEDRGFRIEGMNSRYFSAVTSLRIVCWLNYKALDEDTYIQDGFVLDVLNSLPVHFTDGNIIAATVSVESVQEDDIFSNYSYTVDKLFTFYPYGAFAIDIEVKYRIGKDCEFTTEGTPNDCL